MPDFAGVEIPWDHNGECKYCDEQGYHHMDCPWVQGLITEIGRKSAAIEALTSEPLTRIIRRAKEMGVVGEQADDELAVEVLFRTLDRIGTLEERRALEEARDAALNGVALHKAAADSLAEQCRDLAAKVQLMVDWADGEGLLDDHTFTFPDGDIWEAKK